MQKVINLLGCGSQKRNAGWIGPAKDLYTGSLFKAKRAHAERVDTEWFVVSAKFGLLKPDDVVGPYDLNINQLSKAERALFGMNVASNLLSLLCQQWNDPSEFTIHLHMGKDYVNALHTFLHVCGFHVVLPVDGLGQGQQMKWYSEGRDVFGGLPREVVHADQAD